MLYEEITQGEREGQQEKNSRQSAGYSVKKKGHSLMGEVENNQPGNKAIARKKPIASLDDIKRQYRKIGK